jgi:hypothetical protein
MALVPPGTVVTVAVGGYKLVIQPLDNFWGSPFATQIAQAVGARLHILTLTVNGGDSAADIVTSVTGNVYAYTLTAQISSDANEDPDDLRQAFVAAVFQAAGLAPDTSSVIAVGGTSTGQPVQPAPTSTLKSITSGIENLLIALPPLTLGLVVGAIVLVFVVVSSERKTIVKGLV